MSLDGLLFWVKAIPLLLVILVPLVLVHEFGHFLVARITGIRVLEFGLGFPPKAKTLGHDHETEYTLNWLPIGGFVRLEGEEENSDDPRAFTNAPLAKQLAVLVAGVAMNVLTAVLLLFVVAWAFNPVVQPTITAVVAGSPAAKAGLAAGDTLVSIDGRTHSILEFGTDPTATWRQDLLNNGGKTVQLVVADQNGKQRTLSVPLRVPKAGEGALGVQTGDYALVDVPGNPVQAIGLAVTGTERAMGLVLVALGDIGSQFATNPTAGPQGVQGPVGIASDVGHVAAQRHHDAAPDDGRDIGEPCPGQRAAVSALGRRQARDHGPEARVQEEGRGRGRAVGLSRRLRIPHGFHWLDNLLRHRSRWRSVAWTHPRMRLDAGRPRLT
jgi:regulator of sigma E protease